MAKKITNHRAQAKKFLKEAESKGLQDDFLFKTTLERYTEQIEILDSLKEAIQEYGNTVIKEYVKGRENICINPAITEYNKTVNSANSTATALFNMLNKTPTAKKSDSIADTMKRLMQDE